MLQFGTSIKLAIVFLCAIGVYFCIPNFFSDKYLSEQYLLPKDKLRLGLDLQGGSHLLLGLDKKTVIKQLHDDIIDYTRSVFRRERIAFKNLRIDETNKQNEIAAVSVTVSRPEAYEKIVTAIKETIPTHAGSNDTLFAAGVPIFNLQTIEQKNQLIMFVNPAALSSKIQQAVAQSIEIIRRRIDELGTNEPVIQRNGLERILVQLPGLQNPPELGKTAKLSFHSRHETIGINEAISSGIPPGYAIYEFADEPGRKMLLQTRAKLGGEHLIDAQPAIDQRTGQVVVNFRLDVAGGAIFGRVTSEHIGKPLAIVIDDKIISAPTIQSTIQSTGVITGNFTAAEAKNLSILLRAGALPVPLVTLEERSVGPSLGADSIRAGSYAGIISFIAVGIFMILNYRLLGLFAFISLLINMVFIVASLSFLQATLTLPGIAGIVLTVGMAVDANVLIFERIREELKSGQKIVFAMENGYKRALGTIADANITTLIAAIALILLGSGPVRGFSITLGIGIITSVFTAYMLTRLMTVSWYQIRRPKSIGI